MVQHEGVQGAEGHLVAAVLGGGGHDGAANLAGQGSTEPQATGLVKHALHLGGGRPEPGGAADDEAVVLGELGCVNDGDAGECLAGLDGVHLLKDLGGEGLGDAQQVDGGTGSLGTGGGGLGHVEHVPVHAVEDNGDLGHV